MHPVIISCHILAGVWEDKWTYNCVGCTAKEMQKKFILAGSLLVLQSMCLLTGKMVSRNKKNSMIVDMLDVIKAKQKSPV